MKKLLQDAWRAVAGKKHSYSQSPSGKYPESATRSDADSAATEVMFTEALNAHQSGHLPEAQAAYHRILKRLPAHAPALHFLGVSHGQTGDFAEAERLIRQSIRIRELPEYFSNLALVLNQQGKRDEAITAYREALKRDPGNASISGNLGDLLIAAARYAEAERVCRDVVALQPDDAEAHFKLGVVLAELKRPEDAIKAYRKALALRPAYPEAYNNLGTLLVARHCHADAEDAYRRALRLQPGTAAVHCNLGRLLQDTARHAEAEAAYRQALDLQPEFAGAHNNLGSLYAATGRRSEAEEAYRRALELQTDYADAHNNLGNLLKEMDRRPEAEAAYRQALALRADDAKAWGNLGLLLEDAKRFEAAEAAYRRALSLTPEDAAAHFNMANVFGKTNRNTEAEAAYRRALELNPDYPEACSNLGALLHGSGRPVEAEALYRRMLAQTTDSATAYHNLGGLLLETGRHAEAETLFARALVLQPDFAEVHNCLGTLFKETGRIAEAETAYRRAIALQPDSPGVLTNLGLLFQGEKRFAEAEAAYRQALGLDPGHDFANYNFALLCLSQKRFQEGWSGYERRWKMKDFNALRHQDSHALWQGESLSGESMVVWQEQGVGDVILYAGMIPDLMARGARLVVECEARLVPLLTRSFPQAQVVMRSDMVHSATLEARWQSPLGSLCRWLRVREEDFIRRGPYLVADAARVAAFRKRYRELGRGPVIGISWRSSNHKVGTKKSLSLSEWAPLLQLPGATFVNLQYGDCDDELSRVGRDIGVTVHRDGSVNPLKDLDGFAAQVAAMDLVISTSNSTVHFAGALNVPVWTLLPRGDALLWYWFHDSEDSLWYPSMRLFRQDSPGDWTGPITRVTEALRLFIAAPRIGGGL
jgi:tetratricopeptide (TPR) repeat protein